MAKAKTIAYKENMQQQRAFTLVELSIVLVILGLLIGGVLTGQSLIRASELRTVATQYQRYQTASMTFRDKYFALPGDMSNAQSYWGVQNATPATCITSASTDSKTCNGDSNGFIDISAGAHESYRFWQHLANAGLIEGSYTGATILGTTVSGAANSPAGRISGSYWFIGFFPTSSGTSTTFDGEYGNTFQIGALKTNATAYNPIFKPEEAYNIDTKLDDGKPATGKVVIRVSGAFSDCTDTTLPATISASYLLTNSALTCALMFRQQF